MDKNARRIEALDAAIAHELLEHMYQARIDRKDVAERTGLNYFTVRRYLAGERSIPLPAFISICAAIPVDAGQVIEAANVAVVRAEQQASI